LLYVQNENDAFWVQNASDTGLSRKSFKNDRCRRQKQNCDLRLAQCFGRLLMQITSKDQLDNLIRLLCGAPLASIKNC
jgi:hypothetical protein